MAFKDNKIKGIISNNTGNGIHSFGAFQYFQYTDPVLIDPATNAPLVVDVATQVGLFSSNDDGSNLTEIVLSPTNISISAPEATLSNVTVWSANSILTQGRADARYQNATNNTYANLTGKPTFATVATSGSYNDLANTPNLSLYYLANNPSGYITAACLTYGNITGTPNLSLYQLVSTNTWANLTGKPTLANVATSGDYNDLSNKPASYTLPAATNSTLGGIIVGANLSVSANGTLSANIPAGGGGFANGDILNGGTF